MSMTVAEVEQAMLALDQREIAALVHRGIQALDQDGETASQEEVDAAWRNELAKRIDDIQSGNVETIPLEEAFASARAALAAMR
ncbi:addiction module protein [Propionimicrobium sp. PCR01-08-3]|uniref:addiction module protein n=1 Tax=Propionimicrobium sp. PCR01-08-3 TaxID=3052086 RepID=UPI00255D0798|nr:addiction module protein [Propionimicrobium sp. PCR01-08-3]WIY81943.1 addiction module protein [Propionimicrobium sp. PCR01-08-3]